MEAMGTEEKPCKVDLVGLDQMSLAPHQEIQGETIELKLGMEWNWHYGSHHRKKADIGKMKKILLNLKRFWIFAWEIVVCVLSLFFFFVSSNSVLGPFSFSFTLYSDNIQIKTLAHLSRTVLKGWFSDQPLQHHLETW